MDGGKKQVGFSSAAAAPNNNTSSFTNELFGSNDYYISSSYSSQTSSTGVFGSIFAPAPSKGLGRETMRWDQAINTQDHSSPSVANTQTKSGEGKGQNCGEFTSLDYIFRQQQQQQPCHLSSSIYYGGQDIYSSGSLPSSSTPKNEEAEEDRDYASRGNWWQGSLYY